MSVDEVTIDSILLEHIAIARHIEVLRQSIAEQATFLLESADRWDKTHLGELRERYLRLRDSMQAFHSGVVAHCAHEEKALSPVLGSLVAHGNIVEHKEIIGYVAEALSVLDETGLLGDLKPQELMATTYNAQLIAQRAFALVDTHEANEAGLFGLLKKGLRANLADKSPL